MRGGPGSPPNAVRPVVVGESLRVVARAEATGATVTGSLRWVHRSVEVLETAHVSGGYVKSRVGIYPATLISDIRSTLASYIRSPSLLHHVFGYTAIPVICSLGACILLPPAPYLCQSHHEKRRASRSSAFIAATCFDNSRSRAPSSPHSICDGEGGGGGERGR